MDKQIVEIVEDDGIEVLRTVLRELLCIDSAQHARADVDCPNRGQTAQRGTCPNLESI